MSRDCEVSIHLYEDVAGSSPALPFSAEQKRSIETRLAEIFTPPPEIKKGDSFACQFQFKEEVPGQSFLKSDGTLLKDLQSLGPSGVATGTWATRVLIAQSSDRSIRPQGAMFDIDGRQGCAVFVDAIKTSGMSHQGLLIRTIAHEIGHVFNLAHEDALGQNLQILFDPASKQGINTPQISTDCWEHLLRHDLDSVRPSSGIAFGKRLCKNQHPPADFSGLVASTSSARAEAAPVSLELRIAPGHVYPNPSRPTFVIGEPIHLTFVVTNRAQRTLKVPCAPGTATQDIVVLRLDASGEVESLTPPMLFCTAPSQRSWQRLAPGATAIFLETLLFRNGQLVFPREGTYQLMACLRLHSRWVASPPLAVSIVPPLERRHELSCAIAAHPETGLFVELGGTELSSRIREQLEYLGQTNPKFPLNPLIQLLDGRRDVLAETTTTARSREQLARLAEDPALPSPVRTEADLLLLLDRAQKGDRRAKARLRRRLFDEARLPVTPYAAHLIRRRLRAAQTQSSQEETS